MLVGGQNTTTNQVENTKSKNGALHVFGAGSNDVLLDDAATWEENALINTQVVKTVALPANLPGSSGVMIGIVNPSADTAINVYIYNTEGADDLLIAQHQVLVSSKSELPPVLGFPRRDGGKIVLSIATALGAGKGFTAKVKVRAI